jgi:hypothetical protein
MDLSPINNAIPTFGSPTLEGLEVGPGVQDGQRIGGSSKRQFVRFYNKRMAEPYAVEVRINEKTGATQVLKTAVREVEREMVHVVTPGDKNEVDDFAQDFHRREFWNQYRAFRDGKGIPLGTPIEECQYIAPTIATELKYLGVHTEEQLADAADILVERLPDGYSLREFARTNCKVKLDNQNVGSINLLKAEMLKLQETIQAQAAALEAMKGSIVTPDGEPVQSRRGGRPRKVDLEA